MKYKVVRAEMKNDGSLVESNRTQTIIHQPGLEVGGLYFLRPGKLYRVVEIVEGQTPEKSESRFPQRHSSAPER